MSIEEQKALVAGQDKIIKWLKGFNISLIVTLLGLVSFVVSKNELLFDSQEQKNEVTKTLPEALKKHENDTDRHMSFEEKKELIITIQTQKFILENIEKQNEYLKNIGTDLQEIKNLSRKNQN
ncbi:hypothetical protein [Maribacter flavus]|uniref:Uncharacterized protein n=1 Tax=Maribacter flavus TaxID=1658664 RepID=A0A5B2TUQ0_9FLAO|nr:hypothetical protein [Maribacter flavus]KAA2218266.1 hypothetical protein F0361_01200 [Maribacter flavus]